MNVMWLQAVCCHKKSQGYQTEYATTQNHTDYPETTKATDNNKHSCNQQVGMGCKYLSGNNLPRIKLIHGKLFPDRYLLPMTAYCFQ